MTDEGLTRSEIINVFGEKVGRVLIDAGFSTLTPLADMSREELEEIEGIGPKYSELIYEFFHLVEEGDDGDEEVAEAEAVEEEIASPHTDPPPPPDSLVARAPVPQEESSGPYRVDPQELPPASPRIQRIRESIGSEHVRRAHGFDEVEGEEE